MAAALLGPGAYLSYCDGNTALPGCGYQALHIDSASPWPTPAAAAGGGEAHPVRAAQGESVIQCPSPLSVLKDTYDHSCY